MKIKLMYTRHLEHISVCAVIINSKMFRISCIISN